MHFSSVLALFGILTVFFTGQTFWIFATKGLCNPVYRRRLIVWQIIFKLVVREDALLLESI